MNLSDDEFDHHGEATSSTMSKAELRKTHKPIMEKRRRARINQSLNEIKSLILSALNKDPARHSKLEKADILEMAVKHLQNVQRQQLAKAIAMDPTVLKKFKAGFNECSDEVSTYINQLDGVETDLKQRLRAHLQGCMSGIEQMAQFNNIAGLLNPNAFLTTTRSSGETIGDQNNNPAVQIGQGGLQLIPSRLPTGEFAFLVPNSSNLPFNFPGLTNQNQTEKQQRVSAFATVKPPIQKPEDKEKLLSPPVSPNHHHHQPLEDDGNSLSRSPSPHGFRPVNPSIQQSLNSAFMATAYNKPDLLVRNTEFSTALSNLANARGNVNKTTESRPPIIIQDNRTPNKSHVSELNQEELKTIKFPIHQAKKIEPLCIITNQSERFKQAQVIMDTANCEENLPRGVKRKFSDLSNNGLLTVASEVQSKPKLLRVSRDLFPSSSKVVESAFSVVPPSRNVELDKKRFKFDIVDLTKSVDVEMDEDRNNANNQVVPVRVDIADVNVQENVGNDMWRPW